MAIGATPDAAFPVRDGDGLVRTLPLWAGETVETEAAAVDRTPDPATIADPPTVAVPDETPGADETAAEEPKLATSDPTAAVRDPTTAVRSMMDVRGSPVGRLMGRDNGMEGRAAVTSERIDPMGIPDRAEATAVGIETGRVVGIKDVGRGFETVTPPTPGTTVIVVGGATTTAPGIKSTT